jgi:glycosyltransferase involved in cell wall biosynthesis
MSIIEALLCGNVVVASKQGSIPEMLDANCILLNDTRVETIYSGILEALNRVNSNTKYLIRENISEKLNRNGYDKLLEICG